MKQPSFKNKMLTEKEFKILKSIIFSEYQPGGSPVGQRVYIDCLWDIDSNLTKSGVFGSLVKKGFIGSQIEDNTCWITYAGMKAYDFHIGKTMIKLPRMIKKKYMLDTSKGTQQTKKALKFKTKQIKV